jgi:hypothetical protein
LDLHAWDMFRRGDLLNDLRAGLALVWAPDVPPALARQPVIAAVRLATTGEARRTANVLDAARLAPGIRQTAADAHRRAPMAAAGAPRGAGLARNNGAAEAMLASVAGIEACIEQHRRMVRLEGTGATGADSPDEPMAAALIGDERVYAPAYAVGVGVLRASLAADHPGGAVPADAPLDPGVARDAGRSARGQPGLGPTPASVRQALIHADCDGPGGWREAIQKEITRVVGFDAWELVPADAYWRAKATLGHKRVSLGFLVCVLKQKATPDGVPTSRKGRITLSDPASADVEVDSYSACVDDITDRAVAAVALRLGLESDVADVSGAYFHGAPIPSSEGGRELYAVVPPWLAQFGSYPTHTRGKRNYLFMKGNFPGRRDAGPNWQRRYDAFLLAYGMRQSVVDRRLFKKKKKKNTMSE